MLVGKNNNNTHGPMDEATISFISELIVSSTARSRSTRATRLTVICWWFQLRLCAGGLKYNNNNKCTSNNKQPFQSRQLTENCHKGSDVKTVSKTTVFSMRLKSERDRSGSRSKGTMTMQAQRSKTHWNRWLCKFLTLKTQNKSQDRHQVCDF